MDKKAILEGHLREEIANLSRQMSTYDISSAKMAEMRIELSETHTKYGIRPIEWALIASTISAIMDIERLLDEIERIEK